MKVSIITVCYNNESTIKDTIESVLEQSYQDIEYIIVDGASTDNTIPVINSYKDRISKFVSEPDEGMYEAMNKGIRMASGDVIGILNADDFFSADDVIENIVGAFKNSNTDAVLGDVQFVKPGNTNKIVRYYSSEKFHPGSFKFGFMPAHPGFYVKGEYFEQLGYYKEDYKIASDYELLIRFLYRYNISYKYIKKPIVTMRTGGVSNKSIKSRILLNREILGACKENNIKTNLLNIYSKYFWKIFEYWKK